MAYGRRFEAWDRQSLLCWIVWTVAGREERPMADFNPLAKPAGDSVARTRAVCTVGDPEGAAAILKQFGTLGTVT